MIRLKETKKREGWSMLQPHTAADQCKQEYHRYCLGAIKGYQDAVPGFLGDWGTNLEEMTKAIDWNKLKEGEDGMMKSMIGSGGDKYEWAGLLTCVMYEAIKVQKIDIKAKHPLGPVWDRHCWPKLLKRGTTDNWDQGATGQSMLKAVACLMRALIGYDRTEQHNDDGIRNRCQPIWDKVALRLRIGEQSASQDGDEQLGRFVKQLRTNETPGEPECTRLGLILTIYYGMRSCAERSRAYELTGLIRGGSEGLRRIGQCQFQGQTLSCKATDSPSEGTNLNIWTTTQQSLITGLPPVPQKVLKLTETDSGNPLPKGAPTAGASRSDFTWVNSWNQQQKNKHLEEQKSPLYVRGHGNSDDLRQESRERKESSATRTPTSPRPGNDEVNVEVQTNQPIQASNVSESRDPRSPQGQEFPTRSHDPMKLKEQGLLSHTQRQETTNDNHLNQGQLGQRHLTPADRQTELVEIGLGPKVGYGVGGLMAGVLSLASLYGLYRLYFKKPRRNKPSFPQLSTRDKYEKAGLRNQTKPAPRQLEGVELDSQDLLRYDCMPPRTEEINI
ncbi:hypothetical protein C922_05002 [Plasmodium inui San Antonio 1]|uniref:Uncharacterized protein n=1 Tax=Plasmodium inui San Antonio 1 TaxID=1237626 RepID=W6ZV00_9APIC|nr:hypothetical protein C922_05002 [Plasmodium inui San Antonio 1]EUD64587.1 hypothetical protein C922_05002 [Plasmodium inui San Antonio 1]